MRYSGWLLLLSLGACIDFNDECPPDDTETLGRTEVALDLRTDFVRTRETAVGNLVADSFYGALEVEGADLALVNAGSIRDRGCRVQEYIAAGPVTLGQLSDMLPFGYRAVLVEALGVDLRKALENSVAQLGDPGPAGAASRFLQVSHLRFQVDCGRPAQSGTQLGRRVDAVEILAGDTWTALEDEARYRVATNSFLADGGDGCTWLRTVVPTAEQRTDAEVVADRIREGTVAPAVDGRITLLDSCEAAPETR